MGARYSHEIYSSGIYFMTVLALQRFINLFQILQLALSVSTFGRAGGGGGGGWHPHKVFQSFFLEDKTSSLDVFSSCSFIPYAHFETRLVMVSRYGYDI